MNQIWELSGLLFTNLSLRFLIPLTKREIGVLHGIASHIAPLLVLWLGEDIFLMGALGTARCSHLVLLKENDDALYTGTLLDGFGLNVYIYYFKNNWQKAKIYFFFQTPICSR